MLKGRAMHCVRRYYGLKKCFSAEVKAPLIEVYDTSDPQLKDKILLCSRQATQQQFHFHVTNFLAILHIAQLK